MAKLLPALLDRQGYPILLPNEVQRATISFIDLDFVEGLGGLDGHLRDAYRGGIGLLTNFRLFWLESSERGSDLARSHDEYVRIAGHVPLSAVANCELSKPVLMQLQAQKVKIHIRVDSEGYPSRSSLEYAKLVKIRMVLRKFGSAASDVRTWHEQIQAALHHRGWASAPEGLLLQLYSRAKSTTITVAHHEDGDMGQKEHATRLSTMGAVNGGSREQASMPAGNVVGESGREMLTWLIEMGYSRESSLEALRVTGQKDINLAIEWLLQREKSTPTQSVVDAYRPQAVGVARILERQERQAAERDRMLSEALGDLNHLMAKAEEMVKLAKRFHEKMKVRTNSSDMMDSDLAIELADLGISSPVTREVAGRLYFKELSQQLVEFLHRSSIVNSAGGLVPLTEAYRLFCRARYTHLISPEDFLQAAKLLSEVDSRLRLREFPSGAKVISSDGQDEDAIILKILNLAKQGAADVGDIDARESEIASSGTLWAPKLGPGVSRASVSAALQISLVAAGELLRVTEAKGHLCRDDGPEGVRWYANFFDRFSPLNVQ